MTTPKIPINPYDTPSMERLVMSMMLKPTKSEKHAEPTKTQAIRDTHIINSEVVEIEEEEEEIGPTPMPYVPSSEPVVTEPKTPIAKSDPAKGGNILAEIINPKVLSLLSEKHTDINELLNLSLKQVLADVASKILMGPWQTFAEGAATENRMQGSFLFEGANAYQLATQFYAETVSSTEKAHPISCAISSKAKDLVSVDLVLGDHERSELSEDDYSLASLINYKYLSVKNPDLTELPSSNSNKTQPPQVFDENFLLEEGEEVDVNNPTVPSIFGEPYVLNLSEAVQAKTKKIKVPVARIGKWFHPVYKTVEFSQQDFNDIIRNFNENILGYEPPLFLGHPIETSTSQGHAAEGFLVNLFQEDDELFSEFEVVNDDTFTDVKKGRFRYSSGEFQRSYVAKETGKQVGTTLVGMALTNRPFLTKLPRVTALSEFNNSTPDPLRFQFQLLTEAHKSQEEPQETETPPISSMTNQNPVTTSATDTNPAAAISVLTDNKEMQQALSEAVGNLRDEFSKQLASIQETHKNELTVIKGTYEQQLSDQLQKIATLENESNAKKVSEKLAYLNSLCLPADTKEKFSEMIKQGSMGAAEELLMSNLQSLSESFKTTMTSQAGESNSTEALNDALTDSPYKDIIAQNTEIANQRRAAALNRASQYS